MREARNKKVQTVQTDDIIYGWPQRKKKILDKSQLENIFSDKKFAILSPWSYLKGRLLR